MQSRPLSDFVRAVADLSASSKLSTVFDGQDDRFGSHPGVVSPDLCPSEEDTIYGLFRGCQLPR